MRSSIGMGWPARVAAIMSVKLRSSTTFISSMADCTLAAATSATGFSFVALPVLVDTRDRATSR